MLGIVLYVTFALDKIELKMPKLQWKSRRVIGVVFSLLLFYFVIRVKRYEYGASVMVPKVTPIVVWEFVADFNNMKYLNPTM